MTPERFQRICSVLNQRQPDLTVITDEVHKGHNLAAIMRSCDAVGVDQIHCVMPEEGYQIYGGASAAASASKWVEVMHYSGVVEPILALKAQGFQILAANKTNDSVDYREIDFTQPTAILLGAEVKGVSQNALDLTDKCIALPMVGMVESYNVSVACSGILLEAERQRRHKGMYAKPRLPRALWDTRFFNWAHPAIAAYCDEKGIDYPKVRDDGEIIDLSAWYARIRGKKKPDVSGGRASGQDH